MPTYLEVTQAGWCCDPNRALGYDGFNIRFAKEMWSIIRHDITKFVRQFFLTGQFLVSINTTWVRLVPKSKNPTKIQGIGKHVKTNHW